MIGAQPLDSRARITIERTFGASREAVWKLWTTRDGIEAWWGPENFKVTVHRLDVSPGGALEYSMTAVGQDQIEFLAKAGMPVTTRHVVIYRDVQRPGRLAYTGRADFIPGVEAYDMETVVEFEPQGAGTRLRVTFDAMHSAEWTRLATLGKEMELDRLGRLLAAGRGSPA